jgi:deoxyadenosine/deoxycytidine kinase
MKRFIAIAGNVGAGKSSLTGLLAERLGWTPFFEAVDDNPYLPDFYQDMHRWAFHSQIYFLSRRLRHHRYLIDHPASVVQDRTVYEDAEVFARNLYEQGALSTRDYRSYRELYEVLTSILPPPDLVVYLRASLHTLQTHIIRRGRDFERDIAPSYLTRLNNLYEAWISSFSLCPVLTIAADDLNYVQYDAHLDFVVARILDKLQGKEEVVLPPESDIMHDA